jgi:hypothetical protein
VVRVERPDATSAWLSTEERVVVLASPPIAHGRLASDGTPASPGPGLIAATREALLDLFLSREGRFELRERAAPPVGGVELAMPIQFVVMEGLRLLDEHARLDAAYPDEKARLAATDRDAEELDTVKSAIHRIAHDAPALGEARLVLGLSRAALLRHVEELRLRGLVEVEGIAHGPDIGRTLLDQAQILLAERQFTEAAHVFRTLLASDPSDPRARRLLQEAERLEVEAAYELFSPTDVVTVIADASDARVSGADVAVVDCLTRPRSVAVLVLVSPLREVETLKSIARLLSKQIIAVEPAD